MKKIEKLREREYIGDYIASQTMARKLDEVIDAVNEMQSNIENETPCRPRLTVAITQPTKAARLEQLELIKNQIGNMFLCIDSGAKYFNRETAKQEVYKQFNKLKEMM